MAEQVEISENYFEKLETVKPSKGRGCKQVYLHKFLMEPLEEIVFPIEDDGGVNKQYCHMYAMDITEMAKSHGLDVQTTLGAVLNNTAPVSLHMGEENLGYAVADVLPVPAIRQGHISTKYDLTPIGFVPPVPPEDIPQRLLIVFRPLKGLATEPYDPFVRISDSPDPATFRAGGWLFLWLRDGFVDVGQIFYPILETVFPAGFPS